MPKLMQFFFAHKRRAFAIILIVLMVIAALFFSGAHHEKKVAIKKESIFTVSDQPVEESLAYFGTIQPLSVTSVASVAPGNITELHFHYGEQVTEGDLLLVINSEKLQQDYRDALTNYLKAKDAYLQSQSSFEGSKLLYDNGILPREQFNSAKSQVEGNQLALITASNQLEKISNQVPDVKIDAENLTLADISKIKNILSQEYDELKVYANADGVVLFPADNSGGGGDDNSSAKTLTRGTEVKQGQVLVNIGDLSGVTTTIQVSELDVNRVKPGQNIIFTSPALPGIQLKGLVASVALQAKNQSSGQATFPAIIVVPRMPEAARKLIRIGMEAKVEIKFLSPAQLQIPINAVKQKNGRNYVTLIDAKTKQRKEVFIQTGPTSADKVVVTNGLKAGDQVVVYDKV